jgi:hypothetical protein
MGNDTCTGRALYLAFHDSNEMMRWQLQLAPCPTHFTIPLNNHSCELPHCKCRPLCQPTNIPLELQAVMHEHV